MLLNSVTAVRSDTADGFLPPCGRASRLMACCTAVALLAGAILFARREA